MLFVCPPLLASDYFRLILRWSPAPPPAQTVKRPTFVLPPRARVPRPIEYTYFTSQHALPGQTTFRSVHLCPELVSYPRFNILSTVGGSSRTRSGSVQAANYNMEQHRCSLSTNPAAIIPACRCNRSNPALPCFLHGQFGDAPTLVVRGYPTMPGGASGRLCVSNCAARQSLSPLCNIAT